MTNLTLLLTAADPNLLIFVLLGIIVIVLGSILRYFKQPYIIAYITAGILMGEHGFKLFTNDDLIRSMGEFGLILLLFFIGMEISLSNFIKNWKQPTFGTILQIVGSIAMVAIIGFFFSWSWNRIIVVGFITSLSSSAVVIKILQDRDESQSEAGQSVVSILLMQDILIVPMLIATNYLGGAKPSIIEVTMQVIGGVLVISGIIWVIRKKEFTLPFSQDMENDHELQVIFAMIICFGFAIFTSFFGLSAALGAFVGGMVVNAAKSTLWFHDSLHSFRIIFVALFFMSIGMLIDLSFLIDNLCIILLLLVVVYLANHFINSLVLYFFNKNWKDSFYGGALLAQIGELSFVIVSSAFASSIISEFEYQLTIIIISLTLLISPFWIALSRKLLSSNIISNGKSSD